MHFCQIKFFYKKYQTNKLMCIHGENTITTNNIPSSILSVGSYLAYADDLKFFTVVKDTSECQRLQEMIDLFGG